MLFELNSRVKSKLDDKNKLAKIHKKETKVIATKSNTILDQIERIKQNVEQNLGDFDARIIQDKKELEHYIQTANSLGIISIDTETTGLNPITDQIAGVCLYHPELYSAYVPINHVDYITLERYNWQLTQEDVFDVMQHLKAKIIFHNATFDIRVLRNQLGLYYKCYWDTLICAKLLDENNQSYSLKNLYEQYISGTKLEKKKFKELFGSNLPFTYIPPKQAALYAAKDPYMTWMLYEFQQQYLREDARQDLADVYQLFINIERKIIDVVCNMEDLGIALDLNQTDKLHEKYTKMLKESEEICYSEVEKHRDKIEAYKSKTPNCKLSEPINLSSSTQIAIFLYDILKIKSPDKKDPRGTGEENLLKINNDFTKALLKHRSVVKMLSTYIEKMPTVMLEDRRVHCRFNQYGARTGRFSSSDPNMQNIPTSDRDIRKMFVGGTTEKEFESQDNCFVLEKSQEIQVGDAWVWAELIKVGDDVGEGIVERVEIEEDLAGKVRVWVKEKEKQLI